MHARRNKNEKDSLYHLASPTLQHVNNIVDLVMAT